MDGDCGEAVCSAALAAAVETTGSGPTSGPAAPPVAEEHPSNVATPRAMETTHVTPSSCSDTHPAAAKVPSAVETVHIVEPPPAAASDTPPSAARRTPSKRKRKPSGGGGRHHGHRPPHKKAKKDVSSTHAANNIMKFRLGGSISDPLNLEGGDLDIPDECSTCAPSPALPANEELIPQVHLTAQLSKDPLNLEGKVKNFPLLAGAGGGGSGSKAVTAAGQRRKPRRRTTSGSKADDNPPKSQNQGHGSRGSRDRKFRYGNYNRYYGYRNNGVNEVDPRLALLGKQWLEGQDCLDIGCNTGQVTIKLAKEMCPRKMVGIDIDPKLINTAWKNLYRSYTPSVAPDGRPFPSSLTLARGPVSFPPSSTSTAGCSQDLVTATSTAGCSQDLVTATSTAGSSSTAQQDSLTADAGQQHRGGTFPQNLQFVHGNYVPDSDEAALSQLPEFDVILALSLSKWIHLNWGDAGIKRFFKKVYHHLRPGGRFILEPQPFNSYAKRKKINQEILRNYESIRFRPEEFQAYLLSQEVGFASYQYLGVSENKSKGFRRPIHMYIKGKGEATPSLPRPHSAMSEASSSGVEESGRLKSVVVMTSGQSKTSEQMNDIL